MRTNVVTVATAFLMLCFGMTQSSGDLQDASSYVQVEWRRSEGDQSGRHVCSARQLDNDTEEIVCDTQVRFRQNKVDRLWQHLNTLEENLNTLDIKYNSCNQSLDELQTETQELKKQLNGLQSNYNSLADRVTQQEYELQTETQELKKQLNGLQSNYNSLADRVTLQGNETNSLKQKLNATTTNADNIKNTLSSIRTEDGIVFCGSSNGFTFEFPQNKVKYVRVNFSRAFNRVPEVIGLIRTVDADKNTNLRYKVFIRSIDTTGFTVVCMTWADTILHGIDYEWRATTPLKI